MSRTIIKIGDLFAAQIDDNSKKYFQYIAVDNAQLNSHVIRGFKTEYTIDASTDPAEIARQPVAFYAHTLLRIGVKLNFWEKVGNSTEIGALDHILFRGTNDYGGKLGQEPVKVSKQWYVWKINGELRDIGKLQEKYKDAFIGLVINPKGIIELLRGNSYPEHYPD